MAAAPSCNPDGVFFMPATALPQLPNPSDLPTMALPLPLPPPLPQVRKRKWDSYCGGEELFGLPVTQYPELERTEEEVTMLDKLYRWGVLGLVVGEVGVQQSGSAGRTWLKDCVERELAPTLCTLQNPPPALPTPPPPQPLRLRHHHHPRLRRLPVGGRGGARGCHGHPGVVGRWVGSGGHGRHWQRRRRCAVGTRYVEFLSASHLLVVDCAPPLPLPLTPSARSTSSRRCASGCRWRCATGRPTRTAAAPSTTSWTCCRSSRPSRTKRLRSGASCCRCGGGREGACCGWA